MQKQRFAFNDMTVGVCYYPEHWEEGLWREDLARMLEHGISVVRVAEFGWAIFEPREGEYHFELFDRFLALCLETGMKVIFGTPSATPPAWMTEKYPEILNADVNGVPYRHGLRRHYTYNSPVYRKKCAAIVDQLGRHYGRHPAIIGWQIDNELNCETDEFYAEADSAAFRVFLKERYTTLDALNRAWGAVFWSQTYSDWSQIHVPRKTLHNSRNPHMQLDYCRFVSDSAIRFCALQADILREHISPGVFITTNGLFPRLDNHRLTRETLDVYTYDSYPNFAYGLYMEGKLDALRDRWSCKKLSEVRAVCPHFGIMEQQSGPGSWTDRMEGPSPRPGQMLLWALQSVAHGADFVSFFRWRTCTFGTEIYWHGLLHYDNRDNRRMQELRRFSAAMQALSPVCGAEFTAPFAIVKDYDNEWDASLDNWHRRIANQSEDALFEASQLTHTPCDMLYLTEDLSPADLARYPVLFMPHAAIMTPERAQLLAAYVQAGGALVIGCRSAYKDGNGHCVMDVQPGLLRSLTGTQVEDFSFFHPAEEPVFAAWNGESLAMPVFYDVLSADEGTEVLARFAGSYFAGAPALTERRVGKGRVLHLGGAFSVPIAKALFAHLGILEPFAAQIAAPETVELVQRKKGGKTWLFALNYQPTAQTIRLAAPMKELLTGETCEGEVSLAAYAVRVFEA